MSTILKQLEEEREENRRLARDRLEQHDRNKLILELFLVKKVGRYLRKWIGRRIR